jgi:hypothetical protein
MSQEFDNFIQQNDANKKDNAPPPLDHPELMNLLAGPRVGALDAAQLPADIKPIARPGDDAIQLNTGHKIIGSNGNYRISDADGNSVRISPNRIEAMGKIQAQTRDQSGNQTIKFQNGSSMVLTPEWHLTVTGADGRSNSLTLKKVPISNIPDPIFRSVNRNQRL